ncbi:MAG: hypothetical protein IJT58_01040 [Synergistaceae bacterium]|nr:hypothetical protein [Synergistaceae bacterium]
MPFLRLITPSETQVPEQITLIELEPESEPAIDTEPEQIALVEPVSESEPAIESEPEQITLTEPEPEPEHVIEPESEQVPPVKGGYRGVITSPEPEHEEFTLQYDFTSGQRYVDLVSTKTEFDKMLDELASISHDLLEHESERFAVKFANKFSDEADSEARKYEAFLGGYISNAALILYDKGYGDSALKQLEQAKIMLETKKRLEEETAAIHSRVEENNDVVDLSDILGLFGDG